MFKYEHDQGDVEYPELRSLNHRWYSESKASAKTCKDRETSEMDVKKFITWVQSRGNACFPVPKKLATTLCKNHIKNKVDGDAPVSGNKFVFDSIESLSWITSDDETVVETPIKRKRVSMTASSEHIRRKDRIKKPHCPNVVKTLFTSAVSDDSTAESNSDSDDGLMVRTWTNDTVEKWRKRPEPHRSEGIRKLAREIKVRDGGGKEYVTVYDWSGLQRQSVGVDAIRRSVTLRCIQKKVGRKTYEKEWIPHYQVKNNQTNDCSNFSQITFTNMHTTGIV